MVVCDKYTCAESLRYYFASRAQENPLNNFDWLMIYALTGAEHDFDRLSATLVRYPKESILRQGHAQLLHLLPEDCLGKSKHEHQYGF